MRVGDIEQFAVGKRLFYIGQLYPLYPTPGPNYAVLAESMGLWDNNKRCKVQLCSNQRVVYGKLANVVLMGSALGQHYWAEWMAQTLLLPPAAELDCLILSPSRRVVSAIFTRGRNGDDPRR